MKITFDKKIDAVYIKFDDNATYEKTKKITDNVMVDYDAQGNVVGVELLDASSNNFIPENVESIPVDTH